MNRSTHTKKTELSRRQFICAGAATMGSALLTNFSVGATQNPARTPTISTVDLGALKLFQGAGCNVIALHGDDGALMIDGGLRANADMLLKAVKDATGSNRVHTLINTHWHPEQVGANEAVGRDGGVIIAHEKTKMYLSNTVSSITFEGRRPPSPESARPNKTTRGDGSLMFAGQQVNYGYLPAAHTDGDLFVHFPGLNVLVAGGVVSGEEWPLLDYINGAWLGGRVRAVERLSEIVNPDTRVVPTNGHVITGRDIVRQRDIYDELFQTMIADMNKGFGPEDAAKQNALNKYASEFGDASNFLYGAYRSMLIAYVPD